MRTSFVMFVMLAASCSSGRSLPNQDAWSDWGSGPDVDGRTILGDNAVEDEVGQDEVCSILWQKRNFVSGGTSHPSVGKNDVIYMGGFGKVFALGKTGQTVWTWPDDDQLGPVVPKDEQLHSAVIGKEGSLIVGSAGNRVLVINSTGISRFAVDTEGPVTGAPALAADEKFVVLTDSGALYLVQDIGQNKSYIHWSLTGAEAIADVLAGQQPLIEPAGDGNGEQVLVLSSGHLRAFRVADGSLIWETPLPEGYTATSNMVLDADGTAWFMLGSEPISTEYFARVSVIGVDSSGVFKGTPPGPYLVYQGSTRAVSVSRGKFGTLLAGTNNSGLLIWSTEVNQLLWSHFENFENMAQPVQGDDGLVYFGAWPHWLVVFSQNADPVWQKRLDDPTDPLGAQLVPSSPVFLSDNQVVFHNGHVVTSLRCTGVGPADVVWPRFGGNNRNTGNLSHNIAEKQD